MKSLSSVLLVAIITNTSASETEIRKLELENGFILLIAETIHSRNMPWAFYDQAIKSLPKIHPNTTIVAEERLGKTGKNNEFSIL